MRRILLLMCLLSLFVLPVSAMEFAPPDAPDSADEYMPQDSISFGEDLAYIFSKAISKLRPELADAAHTCLSVLAVIILLSVLQGFSESSKKIAGLVGTLGISLILFQPANTMIQLGVQTITEMSEYGRLLLPVLTAALAAQGGTTASASLYMGTAFFDSILMTLIVKLLIPLLYIYLCLCIADSAIHEPVLKSIKDFGKWLVTWSLKIILYVFTGYISITGVVSGATDAAAVKAAKITISGTVPVVGGILSDASEAILVSAGVMKSAAGVYGILAVIAILIGPFLKIGVQYLLLKVTAAISTVLGSKEIAELIQDFSGVMGLLLAMTGTVCLLLLISTVCFMKGVS